MDVPIITTTQPPLPDIPPTHTHKKNKDYWGLLDKHGLQSLYHHLSHPCFFGGYIRLKIHEISYLRLFLFQSMKTI